MRSMVVSVLAAVPSCVTIMLASSGASGEAYHWVQYGPSGLEARVITDQPACPATRVDDAPKSMSIRAEAGSHYPIRVCTLPIPADARSVTISDVPAALPPPEPRRIVVLGDTGCRLKGSYVQACNDPQQWPFRLIAEVIAHMKPDLVIHVGDYHYRETPCPAGNAGCAGSPFGDTWSVWRADFFAPADTLLKAAPWVFVRGNHEECQRGGQGWSRTLDPDPFDAEKGCNGGARPFAVRLPGLTLAVMDVASAQEEKLDEAQAQAYREQYRSLAEVAVGPIWILQHRPIWSPGGVVAGQLVGDNKTLAAAATGVIPDNVTLILSGHHHMFQVLGYQSSLPVQIVSGHGGDYLNQGFLGDPAGWIINGVTVKGGLNTTGIFGFSMLEKQDGGWRLTNYDKLGLALKSCLLQGSSVTCR
jgi:Calcineurin-like phosphoesterase